MKRRIVTLLSAALLASSMAVLAPTSPASADVDVCAGAGTATTGAPLTYPTVGPHAHTGFAFVFALGTCVVKTGGLTATGTVTGWCGLSWGNGVTDNGHRFNWFGVGGTLVITGELVGVVNAVPDVLNNESCLSGADRFLVNGGVALRHCLVTKGIPGGPKYVDIPLGLLLNNPQIKVCV